jgi:antitoxin VapB
MVATNGSKTTTKKVKLFKNGASQAVRLPAEFRFEGTEIYATRDEETGDVVLSRHRPKGTWDDFFKALEDVDPNDPEVLRYDQYMAERPLNKQFVWRSVFDIDDQDSDDQNSDEMKSS